MMEEKASACRIDVNRLWDEALRRRPHKAVEIWDCILCPDRKIFGLDASYLWDHALRAHDDKLPTEASDLGKFKISYIAKSLIKRSLLSFNY